MISQPLDTNRGSTATRLRRWEARSLALLILSCVSLVCAAQSVETGSGDEPTEAWTSDLKAPLKPADDVGGSWNVALLYGRMTNESMVDVFLFNYTWADAKLLSGEVGYTLKEDNPFVRFMDPVLSSVDVVMNFTYQDDPAGPIYEFNPYVMARWSKFPWSSTVHTTFGLGGGLSFASDIPSIERDPKDQNGDYSKVLHFIAIEATIALPEHKDWQLVYRLHHRSGIFGLMGNDNAGNTAVQIGIRHYFR